MDRIHREQGRSSAATQGAGTAPPCHAAHEKLYVCAHRATKLTEEMPDQKKTRALAAKATVSHTASWMPLSVGRVCVAPWRGWRYHAVWRSLSSLGAPRSMQARSGPLQGAATRPSPTALITAQCMLTQLRTQPRCSPAGPITCVSGQHAPVAGGRAVQPKQADRNHARTLGGALRGGDGERGRERGRRLLGIVKQWQADQQGGCRSAP